MNVHTELIELHARMAAWQDDNRRLARELIGWRKLAATPEIMQTHLHERNKTDFDNAATIDRLTAGLRDAIECVESWAAYADDYFATKWDLAGDLARLRAALEGAS